MRAEPETHQKLVACLLGTLPDADREAVAERSLEDDELFDQLLVVENDLLDRYARGLLKPHEREGFERYLRSLPDGRERVAMAKALTKAVDEAKASATAASHSQTGPASWWGSLLSLRPRRQFMLQYAFLSCLILSVSAVVWLARDSWRLRHENEGLRSDIARMESEREAVDDETAKLKQEVNDQQGRFTNVQREYEREQQRNSEQAEQIARLNALPSPTASLVLTAAWRSSSAPDILTLTQQTKFVRLIAPIARNERLTGCRAVLQTTEGAPVHQWESKPLQPSRASKAITFLIASSGLPPATYKLTVVLNIQDEPEIALDYYFKVVSR